MNLNLQEFWLTVFAQDFATGRYRSRMSCVSEPPHQADLGQLFTLRLTFRNDFDESNTATQSLVRRDLGLHKVHDLLLQFRVLGLTLRGNDCEGLHNVSSSQPLIVKSDLSRDTHCRPKAAR